VYWLWFRFFLTRVVLNVGVLIILEEQRSTIA